jgi:hypothetical protein
VAVSTVIQCGIPNLWIPVAYPVHLSAGRILLLLVRRFQSEERPAKMVDVVEGAPLGASVAGVVLTCGSMDAGALPIMVVRAIRAVCAPFVALERAAKSL